MPTIPLTFQDTGRFVINPNDLFVTPEVIAKHSVEVLKKLTGINEEERMLDVGCGTGRWGHALNEVFNFPMTWGIDLIRRLDYPEDCINPEPYDFYITQDYLTHTDEKPYGLICGNPPYSSKENKNLAEDFIWHSKKLLKPDGYLAFLLKTEYVASLQREKLFKEWPPKYIVQYVPRIHWDGHQFSNTIEYSFYIWQNSEEKFRPQLWWLNWRTGELY